MAGVVGGGVGDGRFEPRVEGEGRGRVDRRADLVVLLGDADEGHRGVAGDQLDLERLASCRGRP